MRYVIIGNSAAGVRAAETLRSLVDDEIIMIAEEDQPAYSRCLLPDVLEGVRNLEDIRIRPRDFYTRNNITTLFGQRAAAIDPAEKQVVMADGNRVGYDKLLIATGASSAMPPIPGINQDYVFGLRHISDVERILQACETARRVVIVGGGFVGLEAAYALYNRGLEVTVVEKLPRILALQFDETAADILRQDMQAEGIRFVLGRGVKEIKVPGLWNSLLGKAKKGVVLEDGEQLQAEVVIMAVGTRANTQLAQNTGMKINRGIPVNAYMETSIPDIYAAGDVAETVDAVTGEVGLSPIWPNAGNQGRIAAYNMAGHKKSYGGLVGMQNTVEFRQVPAIGMGINQPLDLGYEVLVKHYPNQNVYKKLVIKDNVLVGMILVGKIHQAGLYGALIKNKIDISPIKNVLLNDNFSYAHCYTAS